MAVGAERGCLFCAIARGEAEASTVHEDERVVAFMDLQPVTPGHVLVVPKAHAAGFEDLPEELGAEVWRVAHRIGRGLRRSGLRCEGVNLFLADGAAAFQEIPHVHLNVFPRYAGDRFRLDADWQVRDRAELEATAGAVRTGLTALCGGGGTGRGVPG
ncbi:HIT family protein [Streptomyces koyangensis]